MRETLLLSSLLFFFGCSDPIGPPADAGDTGAPTDAVADTAVDSSADAADTAPEPAPCGTVRVREDIGIPTLDGVELSAFVDRPEAADCQLPTILVQTPYDKESAYNGFFTDDRVNRPLFDSPHYNYVVVDWRGRFGSSGLPHAGEGPWLAQDSYDTVEWVAAQPWSNGQVGTWGVSALCGAQYRTAAGPRSTATNPDFDDGPPPSLGAMVPIMCPIRTSYDAVYVHGVLRHEYVSGLDVLGFGLRSIYENNPRKNLLWDIVEGSNPPERMEAPALVVSGFWDLVPTKTVDAFNELVSGSAEAVRGEHKLLIGPWIHFAVGGATSEGAARPLTDEERAFMDFERVIDRDALAFFDHHLRGRDNDVGSWAPVRYHHDNVGWQSAPSWPPATTAQTLYLRDDGSLADGAPTSGSLSFDHDPADPSPTIGGATLSPYNCLGSAAPLACILAADPDTVLLHGPTSQAPLEARTDHLYFETPDLTEALTLLGEIHVFVDVATTADDTDVAIRLVDVDESGEPVLIGEGITRLSARDDDRSWSTVTPGARYSVEVRTNADLAYDLPPGHRLGLFVSAANWPLYARNPGDGAVFVRDDAAMGTNASLLGDPVAATNTLYLDGTTRIEIGR